MTWLAVVIDPLTVHGDRWFLGRMYYYPEGGIYFGVPLSNFVGWFVVGVTTVRAFQLWDRRQPPAVARPTGARTLPYSALLEPALYFGILLFNLVLTFRIGEPLLGLVGVMIFIPIAGLLIVHLSDERRRATVEDLAAEGRDYPSGSDRAAAGTGVTSARRSA